MGGGQDKDKNPLKGQYFEEKRVPGVCSERGQDNNEEVNHPSHYNQGKIETIDFIEDRQHLGFARLNAIKYIDRSGVKVGESKEQSLKKAIWYLEREMGMHKKGDL
jgi:hypothetical protein